MLPGGLSRVHCRYAGVLSAVGIHLADIVQEAQEPTATQLSATAMPELQQRLTGLAAAAVSKLEAQGFDKQHIAVEHFLNLRCGGWLGSMSCVRLSVLQQPQSSQLGPLTMNGACTDALQPVSKHPL